MLTVGHRPVPSFSQALLTLLTYVSTG
jgi:hypothetical protein